MRGLFPILGLGIDVMAPLPIFGGPPAPGFGNRSRSRNRYKGVDLRKIRGSAIRAHDGQPRRECARRMKQQARSK